MKTNKGHNAIDEGGLRYRSKTPGSPFDVQSPHLAASISCFLCGVHRPRLQLKSRKLIGRNQYVCAPSCKELVAQLAAGTKP